MNKPGPVRGYLIDIEGVLVRDKAYRPLAGAVDWMQDLRAAGTPFCLVSNNTTHRPEDLVAVLAAAGFPITDDHLVSALDLGRRWLQQRSKERLLWLGDPGLEDYWRDAGCEPQAAHDVEAVVLGANTALRVADLDRALTALQEDGADLVCLHRNPVFLDHSGERRLGPGAWAAALETAAGPGRVITVGKPAEKIYNDAVKRIGVAPDEVLFISDDPVHDLVTAGKLGMTTAFVLSGKHSDHEILGRLEQDDWPTIICNSLGDLDRPAATA